MISYNLFTEFRDKLLKSTDYSESEDILNEYSKKTDNKIEKNLIKSFRNRNNNLKTNKIDYKKFCNYLNFIDTAHNDDVLELYKKVIDMVDQSQINTLKRIIKNKKMNHKYTSSYKNTNITLYKSCPHCENISFDNKNATYIICGYNTKRGFDWKGCGWDWCFRCGKKLCKSWDLNKLFNIQNRFHNNECCRNHANKLKENYSEEYCQCYEK